MSSSARKKMRLVILRDDDTNALTPVECLERLYRPFLARGLPVNLATIPEVRLDACTPDGRREGFLPLQRNLAVETVALAERRALTDYLHANPGLHLVQHGCHHDRFEFDRTDRAEVIRRLERGAQRLREAGFDDVRAFVAPHDKISPVAYEELAKRFPVISTGWFEWRRLPAAWRPRYLLKKISGRPHWRVNGTQLLSHPGCLLSYQRPYDTMLETIKRTIARSDLTVLVTHWWEYFRDGRPDDDFIRVLHQLAEHLAAQPDICVTTFATLAEGTAGKSRAGRSEALPRARLPDVVRGKAQLIGSRFNADKPRGVFSPIEARLRMGIPYGDMREAEEEYFARRTFGTDVGVLARTALAYALSPSSRAEAVQRPFVVSARVDNVSIDEATEKIFAEPCATRARFAFFVHAHALNLARFNPAYARLLADADVLLPDGIGIRMAANLLGVALRHNINGTDLFPALCREAAKRGIPIVLIGGAPGVAEACAARIKSDTPGLDVPVVSSGFFASDEAAQAVADRIRALGRSLVLVGMGSPRQEEWSWRFLRDNAGATVLTVGGLFDFFSGRIRRAPIFWREAGLEWAYRMLQEPRRLAKRYLFGNPLFLALALEQRIRRRRP